MKRLAALVTVVSLLGAVVACLAPASFSPTAATPSASVSPTATPTATPVPAALAALGAGSRVPWQGGDWYLHGANVPWFNWACDFGCGSRSGASSAAVKTALASKFAQAKAAGMHAVRWWAFEGDPWQVSRDAVGAPSGLNPRVYADFDAALDLAQTYDLYYDFVLFSSPSALPSSWMADPTQRAKLASALAPLFARYRGNLRVLSWEVFNEPEFDIWNGKANQAAVQATVTAIAAAVHQNSSAYVTVGSARLDGLPMWKGQGLDYYQAHWYDYMNRGERCALCTDYATVQAKYGLDAPLVIGELYIAADTTGRFETFYQKGYAGAWPWSLFPDHTNDRLAVDLTQATSFAAARSDLGPRAATGTSTPTPDPSVPPATPSPGGGGGGGGGAAPSLPPVAALPPALAPATPSSATASGSIKPRTPSCGRATWQKSGSTS